MQYLLHGGGPLAAAAVTGMVADHSRFDVYSLVDAALAGKAARSVRMLHGLRAEGVAPPVVLWALARELRQLAAMAAVVAAGQSITQVLGQYHVWQTRKALIGGTLQRLPAAQCNALLRQCAAIDRVCKGQAAGNPWDELLQLTLELAGKNILPRVTRMAQFY